MVIFKHQHSTSNPLQKTIQLVTMCINSRCLLSSSKIKDNMLSFIMSTMSFFEANKALSNKQCHSLRPINPISRNGLPFSGVKVQLIYFLLGESRGKKNILDEQDYINHCKNQIWIYRTKSFIENLKLNNLQGGNSFFFLREGREFMNSSNDTIFFNI